MNKTIAVWSCGHADPKVENKRFDYLGSFLYDLKPDLVVDLGDGADMRSLNSYDTRRPDAIVHQNYGDDIESYLDSQERLRHKFRHHRRKKPFWVGFEGNHEHRIKTAIGYDPRLEAKKGNWGISYKHLETNSLFDEYHEYDNGGPAIATYEGIDFAHYFSSGNFGTATSGRHHAYTLLANRHRSSVCGHSHKRGVYFEDQAGINGLVVGCMKGAAEGWAGQANGSWWTGCVVLREVDGSGRFEPEFVSLKAMENTYE